LEYEDLDKLSEEKSSILIIGESEETVKCEKTREKLGKLVEKHNIIVLSNRSDTNELKISEKQETIKIDHLTKNSIIQWVLYEKRKTELKILKL
jgi:CO dehydrogenase/acetyl-CoA synthase epsilon subunit